MKRSTLVCQDFHQVKKRIPQTVKAHQTYVNPNIGVCIYVLPAGNGAKDFPHPCTNASRVSLKARLPSAAVPQKNGILPSLS
jgi:hypothetical protein